MAERRQYTPESYARDKDNAYRYLRAARTVPGQPMTSLGMTFYHSAHTEAQSGQTPMHTMGRTALQLLRSGEANWDTIAQATLSDKIAENLANQAADIHGLRHIPELEHSFMVGMNKMIFGVALDHFLDSVARLSPRGSKELGGTQLQLIQGVTDTEHAPKPREQTLPIVQEFLADPQTFEIIENLLKATSTALLEKGRPAKDAFLDRLEQIALEHKDDEPEDERTKKIKQKKQMDARRQLWERTHPIILEATTKVSGLSPEQRISFAHNASMVFVTRNPQLLDPNYQP